jgi:hypothetical protein
VIPQSVRYLSLSVTALIAHLLAARRNLAALWAEAGLTIQGNTLEISYTQNPQSWLTFPYRSQLPMLVQVAFDHRQFIRACGTETSLLIDVDQLLFGS